MISQPELPGRKQRDAYLGVQTVVQVRFGVVACAGEAGPPLCMAGFQSLDEVLADCSGLVFAPRVISVKWLA